MDGGQREREKEKEKEKPGNLEPRTSNHRHGCLIESSEIPCPASVASGNKVSQGPEVD